jgi:hypothetical protein
LPASDTGEVEVDVESVFDTVSAGEAEGVDELVLCVPESTTGVEVEVDGVVVEVSVVTGVVVPVPTAGVVVA